MDPATLAQTDDTSITITHLSVFRSGTAFTLAVRLREPGEPDLSGVDLNRALAPAHRGDSETPPDLRALRLGVRFSDGRLATNLDEWPPAAERTRHGPVLSSRPLRGGRGYYRVQQWLDPLPPPGPVTFVCDWPIRNIGESNLVVDGWCVRDAARHALTLWPT